MDANFILQAISSVGFPIVACAALAFLLYREQENHKQETNQFTRAINELTIALTKLSDSLGGDT